MAGFQHMTVPDSHRECQTHPANLGDRRMAYDGFISYSHAADGRLAPALQRGLQRLAKPWNSRRALRIFRDETGLSTNPHLWSAIEQALDESEWFVLLASPESAQSVWVGKEVAHWLETKSVDRILPVVTDGTWEWDAATGDFTPESSAVPDALRGALVEEPRHLDLAWARDETDLDLRNSRFRSAIADLAAPMHGIAKDDLEGEDIRLQRRARLLARGGVAALALLLVVSLVASVFAIGQRNTANHQTALAKADAAQARQELLISQSQGAVATDRQLATLLAIEADRESPSAASEDALLSAVLAEPRLQQSFAGPTGVLATLVDNRVAIVAGTTAQVWDYRTGQRQAWPSGSPLPTQALWLASTGDGSVLAVLAPGGMVWFYSGQTLQPLGNPLATGLTSAIKIKFSLNGSSLAVWGTEDPNTPGHPVFADYTGQGANWVPAPAPHGLQVTPRNVDFSTDGSVIVSVSLQPTGTGTGSDLTITDVATGEVLKTFVVSAAYDVALDWGRQRVVVSRIIGGAPGDASWYDLTQPVPTEHVISLGLSPIGSADLGYDASHTVLGINGSAGFMALDANTMAPVPGMTEINTGTQQGPVRFLDPNNLSAGHGRRRPGQPVGSHRQLGAVDADPRHLQPGDRTNQLPEPLPRTLDARPRHLGYRPRCGPAAGGSRHPGAAGCGFPYPGRADIFPDGLPDRLHRSTFGRHRHHRRVLRRPRHPLGNRTVPGDQPDARSRRRAGTGRWLHLAPRWSPDCLRHLSTGWVRGRDLDRALRRGQPYPRHHPSLRQPHHGDGVDLQRGLPGPVGRWTVGDAEPGGHLRDHQPRRPSPGAHRLPRCLGLRHRTEAAGWWSSPATPSAAMTPSPWHPSAHLWWSGARPPTTSLRPMTAARS